MQRLETGDYPYYIVPAVEAYKKLPPESEEARKLVRLISANVGDYAALRLVLGIDPPEFARFYPDMESSTPSTMDTIDAFLEKFGTPLPPGSYVPEPAPYNLEREEEREEIIEEEKPSEPQEKVIVEEREDPGDMSSESLAELLGKRRYREALKFIERQNLNNPQKSIYFAHQMRFIKKLIRIEKYRNQTKG